jgi:predicted lipoprotein with Yx(FWY)xxD motif
MARPRLLTLATLTVLIAGCGGDDEPSGERDSASTEKAMKPADAPNPDASKETPRQGTTVKVVSSRFGKVLADARGQAFYLFDKEKTKQSECYGACAKAWPPALTKGEPRAGSGARGRLLGTTRRRDGKVQVTYRGQPLYYYVDDSPGQILCHNVDEFGGLWLVVRPDGSPVG